MGLDQYFTAKIYLSEYQDDEKQLSEKIYDALDLPHSQDLEIREILVRIGTLRKAYKIDEWIENSVSETWSNPSHAWLSEDVIDGLYKFSEEQLKSKEYTDWEETDYKQTIELIDMFKMLKQSNKTMKHAELYYESNY